jgi:hypothetical protein
MCIRNGEPLAGSRQALKTLAVGLIS